MLSLSKSQHCWNYMKYNTQISKSTMPKQSQPQNSIQSLQMFPRNISIPDFKVEPCRQRSRDHIHYRISEENKEKLLTFIIHQNLKTKEAAKQMNISYSTAKKIYARFRKSLKCKKCVHCAEGERMVEAGYKEVEPGTEPLASLMCIIGTISGRHHESQESELFEKIEKMKDQAMQKPYLSNKSEK